MPLAALIIAGDLSSIPTILGQPIIEFQLRRARKAGAVHAIVLADDPPEPVLASIDLVRAEGMTIDLLETAAEVAECIDADERVLLLSPSIVVEPKRLLEIARSSAPALLCLPRDHPGDGFELIDASARWTGTALLDAGVVREIAPMAGDWDLSSLLLRRLVQENTHRVMLSTTDASRELTRITADNDGAQLEQRLLAGVSGTGTGVGQVWLVGPIATFAARFVVEWHVRADWLTLGANVAMVFAAAATMTGLLAVPLAIFVAALVVDQIAEIVGNAGSRIFAHPRGRDLLRTVAGATIVLATSFNLTVATGQWACLLLGLLLIGATALTLPLVRANRIEDRWLGDDTGYAILLLFGALAGTPVLGLGVVAAYAVAGLVWTQMRFLRKNAASRG